jgi:23S rRNA (adenine2503-C2)-methyltransferase
MELIRTFGRDDLAKVYVLRLREGEGRLVECVESLQPPRERSEKWVLIVSTLFGCPVRCRMCDAGGWYRGRLTGEEILDQIRFLVGTRFGGRRVPVRKFKIQFSRMGEPALNPALIGLLERLPGVFEAPGLLPSLSTVGPAGAETFFERLIGVKDRQYAQGRFQLQFSIHTTDPEVRKAIIPIPCLDYAWIGDYGRRFRKPGDQRITLNFAAIRNLPVEPEHLKPFFDPEHFLIKLTPLNPTARADRARLASGIDPLNPDTGRPLAARFERAGYRVLLSIGEVEENAIGSNCGQYVSREWAAGAGTPGMDPPRPSA